MPPTQKCMPVHTTDVNDLHNCQVETGMVGEYIQVPKYKHEDIQLECLQ
jgi:hypothetical protein